eukprot:gene16935-23249_t
MANSPPRSPGLFSSVNNFFSSGINDEPAAPIMSQMSMDAKMLSDKLPMVEEEDPNKKSEIEKFRLKLKSFLLSSFIGKVYELVLLIISLISTLQYIVQTYLGDSPLQVYIYQRFTKAELAVASLFLFDWWLNLFLADNKMIQLTGFYSMVDLMTVVPIFITYYEYSDILGTNCISYAQINSLPLLLLYIMCGLKTTRILRALRLRKWFLFIEDEVEKCLAIMAMNIVVMILFNSALMQFLESQRQNYRFHTWAYYMMVTVSTVGYGDIHPVTTLGRFAAMGMISFAIISVPQMTNELIEKMNAQSIYQR